MTDRAYFRINVTPQEHDEIRAEARLAGYLLVEYLRVLLREGRSVVRQRGVRRSGGLHFLDAQAGPKKGGDRRGRGTNTESGAGAGVGG